MDKEKLKKLIKSNKAAAVSLAVAFVISNPLAMTGCTNTYYPDDEYATGEYTGSSGGSHYIGSGSSGSSKSTWSTPSESSGGYSTAHGGTSSAS
ncbi:MAG: hypothetical protein Q8930_11425 [Bacillota bacterium]|nr:hypothetical protein [Bacillota bacterium]